MIAGGEVEGGVDGVGAEGEGEGRGGGEGVGEVDVSGLRGGGDVDSDEEALVRGSVVAGEIWEVDQVVQCDGVVGGGIGVVEIASFGSFGGG